MNKVVKFYPKNAAENPDAVLEQAIGKYESVFVVGWGKEGMFDPRSSTNLKSSDILYLIEIFKHKLLAGDYNE